MVILKEKGKYELRPAVEKKLYQLFPRVSASSIYFTHNYMHTYRTV